MNLKLKYGVPFIRYPKMIILFGLIILSVSCAQKKDIDAREVVEKALLLIDPNLQGSDVDRLNVQWEGTRRWGSILAERPTDDGSQTYAAQRFAIDKGQKKAFQSSSWQYHGYEIQTFSTFLNGDDRGWYFTQGFGEGEFGDADSSFGESLHELASIGFLPTYLSSLLADTSVVFSFVEDLQTENVKVKIENLEASTSSTLSFDPQNSRLLSVEKSHTDPLEGPVKLIESFFDYESIDGFVLPHRRLQNVGSRLVLDMKARYQFNVEVPDSLLRIPSGYFRSILGEHFEPRIETIADGVFLVRIRHNMNMVFVDSGDYWISVFAPWNAATTRLGLELISDQLNGKPLKFSVLTTHHWDASGGVAPLVSEGASLVTQAVARTYFREMVRNTLPESQTTIAEIPFLEIERTEANIGGSSRDILVLPVTGSPNTENSLYVYIPDARVLISNGGFEAGMYKGRLTASDETLHMIDTVDELGLDVGTVVHVNGGSASWNEVEISARSRKTDLK